MDLANKILSDPINQWLFNHARKDIYLVGGYIRDLLHGGDISKDKDYILKHNARQIALITSNKFKGTFIELKKDRMFRVALSDGQFLDFSQMQNNVLKDLSKRDFRINAIAWSPVKGLIDPFEGLTDLKNKIIRMISPENLAEDPLRILRAYRLAAQLGYTIERDTHNYLRKYSSKIKETASERITQELFKLLMTDNASYYMSLCEKDKVLHKILNVTNAKIKDNLLMLIKFDQFIKRLGSGKFKKLFYSAISPFLNITISQGLSRIGLIRLSILLNNMNKANATKCFNLRYSKSIVKRVMNIQDGMMLTTGRITTSKLYDIFTAAVDCEYEAALIVSVTRQNNVDKFINRANDFIKFKKYPLLDGHEIKKILNIGPSALIGKIQVEIHKRRFLGIIRTKTEAQHWIISNLT